MTAIAWALPPIGLAELDARAALQHRVDVKYLITAAELDRLLEHLSGTHVRLEIDGRSSFRYRSSYLDTAGLDCVQAHRQGRRLRFKARTRSYDDSGLTRLEVKLKDGRGATRKLARSISPAEFGRVTAAGAQFVAGVLADAGVPAPGALAPALLVEHRRTTLMAAIGDARMTIDTGLQMHPVTDEGTGGPASGGHLRPGLALIETKSARGRSTADEALRRMGLRPVAISKYCVGMSLTRPGPITAPWQPLARRYFVAGTAAGPAPVPAQGRLR